MPPSFRLVPVACLLCLAAACQRAPDDDSTTPVAQAPAPAAGPRSPAPAASTPAPATGVAYACADGTRLRLEFGGGREATLRWPDGRTLRLPRAESASKGGGDVYVGDTVSLQRDGTRVQLHDGGRAPTACDPEPNAAAPAPATATPATSDAAIAARYACDAGAILTLNADGSFRAEVPGNPPVRLGRIAGSEPPVFTGASLYLRIGDGDAVLSQGDRANELHCTAG